MDCVPDDEETVDVITPEIDALIGRALAEDLSAGDPTTEALIPEGMKGAAVVVTRVEGVLAGVDVAAAVFRKVDPDLKVRVAMRDGSTLKAKDVIAEIEGPVPSILKGERTALNFLQRLSGIATETRKYVKEVAGYHARILDTRKTTPGLRSLEKYAVRAGGGHNHRRGLGDGILVKDNHIQAMRQSGLRLREVIERVRLRAPHTLKIEVEVEDLEQVREALGVGVEVLLLDNMGIEEMTEAVRMAGGRAITEASGRINLQNVRAVAATGVDLISVGALTHSVRALDISLDLV